MKKIILISFVFFCVTALPSFSHAQSYFGGRAIFEFPCTCGGVYTYFYFTPLYLNSGTPTSGGLALLTTGTTYANYYLVASGWALGHYTTGIQACYMAGDPCFVYTTVGLIRTDTGTSL